MRIAFSRSEDGTGVTVSDAVERRQYTVETAGDPTPRPVEDDRFLFPIDEAVALETDRLTLPSVVATYVRDADREMLAEVEHFDERTFGPGQYSVELCAPIKLYVSVEGPLTIGASADRMTIELDGAERLYLGARSHHKQPAATITTTDRPRDVMAAVSALGSSLKATSPERSYPTLRGHPPTIELGDELDVPSELSTPETGVRIEVPPKLEYVFPVAPLAFYLGATVEAGATPRIVADDGFEHALDSSRGFEDEVERVLKQVFFFDCVTRTEGYYQVDLHERREIERYVDIDFADLYDRRLSEQLRAYLDVPFEVIEDLLPEWKLTSHVDPTPENAEMLPFLVNDLAVVKLPKGHSVTAAEAQVAALDEFTREAFTRSAATGADDLGTPSLVQPTEADSLEQAWAGDEAPVGASKASVEAFRNRLDRGVSDGDIDITVVCNDEAMDEEGDVAEEVYGSREDLPFDVQIYRDLSTAALRAVLETEVDFLHYVGHIDEDGFDCADGKLDARDLEFVGVDAFLLNACRSYDQGMALIDRGAIGGVVTLAEVINSGAVRIGKTMIRLLNQGFPLKAALDIAKTESIVGGQYIVVGDGNMDAVQSICGQPALAVIEKRPDGRFDFTLKTYPTYSHGMGSINMPICEDDGRHFIGSGTLDTYVLDANELEQAISAEDIPVKVDQRLYWSSELDVDDI